MRTTSADLKRGAPVIYTGRGEGACPKFRAVVESVHDDGRIDIRLENGRRIENLYPKVNGSKPHGWSPPKR